MAINVTKPSVNLREKLNELETNKGLKGNEILQAETAQEVRSLIGAGRKNLIINGDMQVSQRGNYTTATTLATGSYFLDRFKLAAAVVTAQVSNPEVTLPNGDVTKSAKVSATSAGTGFIGIRHTLEGYKSLTDKTVTVSCWMRSNSAYAGIRQDSLTDRSIKHSGNGEWEYITTTWKYGTLTADNNSSTGTTVAFITYNNANVSIAVGDYIEIAQVQLELGSVATDFEHRSYGEELALCQRYFQKSYTDGIYAGTNTTVGIVIVNGSTEGGSSSYQYYTYPVPMRAAASITFYNSSGASGVWQGNSSPSSSATRTVALDYSGTAGFYFHVGLVNTWVVCQVYGHFTADAEL